MKVKTSITLSEDLIEMIDRLTGETNNRSEFIETALRNYIARQSRDARNRRDLMIINRRHARLNKEAADALAFQGEW